MLPTRHLSISVQTRKFRREAGFTLAEILTAMAILALISGSIIWGLNMLNYYASVNRLYTAAQTLAQNQIDLVLTKAPYDPSTGSYPTPNVLQIGTYYSDPSNPNTLSSTAKNVPIYTDPSNNKQIVVGTIKTTVTDPGVSVNGTALNLRQATVVVSYQFRNKTFSVKMDTIRASDI